MTYDALLDLFWRGLISLNTWGSLADERYPVAPTPAKTVLRPLAEIAPTYVRMLAAEAEDASKLRSAA